MTVKITVARHWYKVGEVYKVEEAQYNKLYYQLLEYPEKHKIPIIRKEDCVLVTE